MLTGHLDGRRICSDEADRFVESFPRNTSDQVTVQPLLERESCGNRVCDCLEPKIGVRGRRGLSVWLRRLATMRRLFLALFLVSMCCALSRQDVLDTILVRFQPSIEKACRAIENRLAYCTYSFLPVPVPPSLSYPRCPTLALSSLSCLLRPTDPTQGPSAQENSANEPPDSDSPRPISPHDPLHPQTLPGNSLFPLAP